MSVRSFAAGGCGGSCESTARVLTDHDKQYQQFYGALTTAVSIYGTIRAIALQERMVKVAERAADRADEYLSMAKYSFYKHAVPTHLRMRRLYDRYTKFWNRENQFISESYRLKEYRPRYDVRAGRAMARVQAQMDRAAQAVRRATGRHNTGRACHFATQFAISSAIMRVDSANQAYRFEDTFKLEMDKWYFSRWQAGADYVRMMGDRGQAALLSSVAQTTNSLNAVGNATRVMMEGSRDLGSALGSLSNTYANLGNSMARGAGYFNQSGASGLSNPFGLGNTLSYNQQGTDGVNE